MTTRRLHVWLAAFALIVLSVAAYHNSFSGPFVFDDTWSIPLNPSIRQFSTALTPPNDSGETVSGRPLLNLSFALNYAISGKDVRSYHVVNLLIHIAAGLVFFGLVRRTLLLPALRERFGGAALPIAFAAAALWLAHPLQTQSVTYIVQRAESLMALLYLLTLYCFARHVTHTVAHTVAQAAEPARGICDCKAGARLTANPASPRSAASPRSTASPRSAGWLAASVLFCLLGMAAKEVMVSAPLIVLLYDRAFIAGTIREALARRRAYYASLATTLLLLLWLVIQTGNRGNTAGFGIEISPSVADVSTWTYLLTQAKAITLYIRLALWPAGQVFDYGTAIVTSPREVWLQGLCVLALAGGSLWLLARRPAAGLVAFFFFAVLAPTSSIVPVATEPVAEHRMYLPLAALALAAALASWRWIGRRSKIIWGGAGCAIICALALATVQRNKVYSADILLWRDTVEKVPGNARANSNYANTLTNDPATCEEAIRYCRRAIDLNPGFAPAYNNYGYALSKLERHDEALAHYDKALSLKRMLNLEITLSNRGVSLGKLGRMDEAEADFKLALQIRPDYEEALNNYGNILHAMDRPAEALECFDRALAIDPGFASAWNNRGNIFSARGLDRDEAMRCYKRAAALDPALWEAQDNVGRYSMALNRPAEAVPYFRAALAASPPDESISRYRLANALMLSGDETASIPEYQKVIALRPAFFGAHYNLAVALLNTGRELESIPHFETALRLDPAQAPVHSGYATALARLHRYPEALAAAQTAHRLDPAYTQALAQIQAYQHHLQ